MDSHPSVVVIEDDEDDFLLVKELLEENFDSPEVFWYPEPPKVDDLLRNHRIDVVIVDYRLGETTGDDYIREIRTHDSVLGVILLTGVPTRSLDFKASEIGASDFLSKDEIVGGGLERSIRFTLESVRQKRQLLKQSARLENILRPTKTALWSLDLKGRQEIFFSESIEDLTGHSKKELEEETVKWIDLVVPEDTRAVSQLISRVKQEHKLSHQYKLRKKDGDMIWVEEELHYTREYKGDTLTRIEGRIRDITDSYEQEQRLQLLANTLECAGDGILITDAQLELPGPKIVYANKAMQEMCGYDQGELVGQTPRMMQGPKTSRKTLNRLKACLRDGRDFEGTTINRRKDGSEYCLSWTIRPIKDESGKVTHYVSVQRDITANQEQQLKLQQSEDFLLAMGENANIGGWRYNEQSEKLIWTAQMYSICKLDPSESPQMKTWLGCFQDSFREKLDEASKRCLLYGESFTLELNFRDLEGSDLWVRIKGEPQYLDGIIVGMWGTFQDITNLHDQDFRNRTFFNLSIDLSGVFAESGEILELNGDWEKVTGLSINELKKRNFIDFVVDEDKERTMEAHQNLQSRDGLFNFENTWQHQNGEIVHLLWNAKIDPATKSVFALCRDITEIKNKEILLLNALEQAEVANQSKSQFLMAVSHELRTPLNPIGGFADILAQEITDQEQLKMLEMISDAATHLTTIVSDILEISSIETGQAKLVPLNFKFSEKIESLVALMKGKANDADVTLNLVQNEALDEVKNYTLRADFTKIRQVLFNLLGNAIKFSPGAGEVTLQVESIQHKDAKLTITMAVADNGIGIPESEFERIFDRFHQVSMTHTRRFGGQGLGLAISREFARILGGNIRVESQIGKGSVFRFDFDVEIINEKTGDVERVSLEKSESTPLDTDKIRVLVAEDDLMNQRVVLSYLKRLNVDVVLVGDGDEAVKAASEQAFALILMDLQMPTMSGIDACSEIRKTIGPNQHTKVCALSAHVAQSVKDECRKVGMDAFMEKPVGLKKFEEIIESARASAEDVRPPA